jgi:predicted dehydrogenase
VFVESTGEITAPVYGGSDPYQRQVEAFAAAIAADTGTDPDGRDGVAALRLIEAVADSAANDGKEVTL